MEKIILKFQLQVAFFHLFSVFTSFQVSTLLQTTVIFVFRKKGSKAKKRMKEEEIEKSDCRPPAQKGLSWKLQKLGPSGRSRQRE